MPSGPDWPRYVRTHLHLPGMRAHREDRIVAELADHLEDVYRDARSRGASDEEARAQARQRLGDADVAARELVESEPSPLKATLHRHVEETDMRLRMKGGRWIGIADLFRDLRYGARTLCKRPGFTLVAILSLAIGIGANTAIFSLVNALILRDPPYERPDELVDIHLQLPDNLLFTSLSYPDFDDLRRGTTAVFAGVVGSQFTQAEVDSGDGAANVFGEAVTGNYFSVLGIDTILGRAIGPDDDRTLGAHPVVVLSHSYWQSRFSANPDIVGHDVQIEGRAYTIIGVATADYPGMLLGGLIRPAFYAPMMMLQELNGGNLLTARDNHNMTGKARLAPGVTLPQAETVVAAVSATLSATRPEGWDPAGAFSLMPTTDVLISPDLDGGLRTTARLLMVVVGLVLLLACLNLAGFLLARALDRRREVAVRLALGASRGALIRQLLTESTLLSLVGGGVGLGLAVWLLDLLPKIDLGLPVTVTLDVAPDATVLAFTLGISVLAGTVLGLVPALQSTRPDVVATLKSETAGGGKPGSAAVAQCAGRHPADRVIDAPGRRRALRAQPSATIRRGPGIRTDAGGHPDRVDARRAHSR